MLNKILSKKIKFPPSLRGAKRRSNLNHNGFSLIELMVAAAILSMVIFGIFQAYSTSFRGMADARDRTVATNYMQEAMEDVKNMDFEKIATTTRSVTDGNRKYRIDVNLIEASDTFKKVYTVVSWKDRNGETKTVVSSLTVNFTEVFASDAAKIVLFADSYSIINDPLSEYSSTDIIAVIKDINGNTITDWEEGDVTFEIISSAPLFGEFGGGLSIIDAPTVEGRASITFFSKGTFVAASAPTDDYYVLQEIEASVYLPDSDKTVTDTIYIKITDGPVKIIINDPKPNPESIKAGIGNYSTITASVINAAEDVLLKKDIFKTIEITFSASGEGKFENDSSIYTITIPWDSGSEEPATVTVNLYSTGISGLVNIVATSPNLESNSTKVTFLGPPVAISISANPSSIYVDDTEGSTISVSLVDSKGYPTNPTVSSITILLSLTDNGTGGSIEVPFSWVIPVSDLEGIIYTTKFSGQDDTGTAIINANGGGFDAPPVTINVISSLVPDHIALEADDQTVGAGDTTTIKAIVYDEYGKIVTTYTGAITFNTDFGILSNYTFENGVAYTDLYYSYPGTVTVTVSSSDSLPYEPEEGVVVIFYGTADHIELDANPEMVKANGTDYSTITAIVCDENNNPVLTTYTGNITFEKTDPSSVGFFDGDNPVYTTNGKATIKLVSSGIGAEGSAFVTVSTSPGLPSPPDPVGGIEVEFYEETTLTLVPGTTLYEGSENKIITFDIKVSGENIEIDDMRITWTYPGSSERLEAIGMDISEVWSSNGIKSGIIAIINDTLLSPGETNVRLTFKQDMTEKYPIEVIFYPPVSGQYIINLDSPLP